MKIAVGYLRCSTDQQEDSTRQQQEEIQRYADQNGYRVMHWYEDFGHSGTTFRKRPAFMEMLRTAERGEAEFRYIFVYDESRWGRASDPEENAYWENKFRFEFGIQVVLLHTLANTDSAIANSFLKTLQRSEASEYSKKLSRATLRGSVDNARHGNSCGGSAPYGYRRIAVDRTTGAYVRPLNTGQLVNNDEKSRFDIGSPLEVEIVKRIFAEKVEGKGYVGIADGLNRDNIPPPQRGRWRNRDQKWSGVTVRGILSNPTYYGVRVYNRHPQSHLSGSSKEAWQNPQNEWILTEDAHPAIVSKETFQLANQHRQDPVRNRHTSESPYLLTSLIKCGRCGFNFQGQNVGRKHIRYYVDGAYRNKGNAVCSNYQINKEELENFVIREIRKRILTSDLPAILEADLREKLNAQHREQTGAKELFERQLTDVNTRIQRLLTLAENSTEVEDAIVDKLKLAGKEKKQLEKRLEELNAAKVSAAGIDEARKQVEYLLAHFEEVITKAPIHVQKELLRHFVQKIIVERETDTIKVYLRRIPSLGSGYSGSNDTIVAVRKHKTRGRKKKATNETTVPESREPEYVLAKNP